MHCPDDLMSLVDGLFRRNEGTTGRTNTGCFIGLAGFVNGLRYNTLLVHNVTKMVPY